MRKISYASVEIVYKYLRRFNTFHVTYAKVEKAPPPIGTTNLAVLTKPNHPWTNGQVEPMNRTIKEVTVKRFHHENYGQLRTHLPTTWPPTIMDDD